MCNNPHDSHAKMLTTAPSSDRTVKCTVLPAKLQSRRPPPSSKGTTDSRSSGSDQTMCGSVQGDRVCISAMVHFSNGTRQTLGASNVCRHIQQHLMCPTYRKSHHRSERPCTVGRASRGRDCSRPSHYEPSQVPRKSLTRTEDSQDCPCFPPSPPSLPLQRSTLPPRLYADSVTHQH